MIGTPVFAPTPGFLSHAEALRMELFRLYAYTVAPSRPTVSRPAASRRPATPRGGLVTVTSEFRLILEQTALNANFERRTRVDFNITRDDRSNAVRDLVMKYGFGTGSVAKTAAAAIAERLATAMDRRSTPCLLVIAAMRDRDRRSVTIWTFPRDQVLRLQSGKSGASIEVLNDIFSQTSKLRKAALFAGRNIRGEFLQGRVLDFQVNQSSQEVADFWIGRFLDCVLSIADDTGTRMLANTIRRAVDSCDQLADQEQILTAMMSVRTSPQLRWSLRSFANQFLSGIAKDTFLASAPNKQVSDSFFAFSRDEFERTLPYRIYSLRTGVFVTAPAS